MNSEAAVLELRGVGKEYRTGQRRGITDVLGGRRGATGRFCALDGIDLRLMPGETVALLGTNGSGKSTLLKLAAGVTAPSRGTVHRSGRVISVISFGGNFDHTLTGAENAVTALILNGMTSRKARELAARVGEFSELGEFFHRPVRTYSSGMVVRLAFGVIAQLEGDLIVLDEVLSVGDLRFQERCLDHLRHVVDCGAAMLVATHDLAQAQEMTSRAIWIDRGRVVDVGPTSTVCKAYREAAHRRTLAVTPTESRGSDQRLRMGETRFGSQELTLEQVAVNGVQGATGCVVAHGEPLSIAFTVGGDGPARGLHLTVTLRRDGTSTPIAEASADLGRRGPGETIVASIAEMRLGSGPYVADVGIYGDDWEHALDFHWDAYRFAVRGASARGPLWTPVLGVTSGMQSPR